MLLNQLQSQVEVIRKAQKEEKYVELYEDELWRLVEMIEEALLLGVEGGSEE